MGVPATGMIHRADFDGENAYRDGKQEGPGKRKQKKRKR
jgi:hypothetical protein